MNYKFPFFVLAVGVLIAGVSPFGMSQVQEDAFMEIDMLQTQVEYPFRIQDSTDTNVFCIDTLGKFACGGSYMQELYYHRDSTILSFSNELSDLPTTTKETTNDSVLAQWSIDAGTSKTYRTGASFLTGELRRDSGAGNCNVELEVYIAGAWTPIAGTTNLFATGASFVQYSDADAENFNNMVDDIRLIAFVSDDSTTCSLRYVDLILPWFTPNLMTVDRVK